MISVLQILLKILGIILLSLIGIIIVLLLVVLFVPVRYRFQGYYKDEFVCHGKVTWLLHLVSVSIDFEKELSTSIKILGIPLSAFQKKNTSKEDAASTEIAEVLENDKQQEVSVDHAAHTQSVEKAEDKLIEQKKAELNESLEETDNIKEEKIPLFEKIKRAVRNVIQKIQGIINKIRSFIYDIQDKKAALQHYLEILRKDEVKQAFSVCKKRICKLIKHILPKKMKVSTHLGFDDPSTTGYILAIYGMLPASVGKKIILYPDFEHAIIDCDFMVKGSVNAWSMLHQLLCILSDKNCRALYHIVKKEILNERK